MSIHAEDCGVERLDEDTYIAAPPDQLDYDRAFAAVVVSAFGADQGSQWTAVPDLSRPPERSVELQALARRVRGPQREHGAAMMVLTGYGPEGGQAAQDVPDALADGRTHVFHLARIEQGRVGTLAHDELRWTSPRDLPDTAVRTVLQERHQPPTSSAELSARYAPSEAATCAAMSPVSAVDLTGTGPSLRADVAARYLDRLCAASGVPPAKQAALARQVNGDLIGRDAALVVATTDRAHASDPVDDYRGAPVELRPAFATAAGAALSMHDAPLSTVTAVLAHADHGGQRTNLTRLVETATRIGLNGHDLRAALTADLPGSLPAADQRWGLATERATQAAAFPPTRWGRRPGRAASNTATRRDVLPRRGHTREGSSDDPCHAQSRVVPSPYGATMTEVIGAQTGGAASVATESDLCALTAPYRCWVCRLWWQIEADDKECLDAQAGVERCAGPSTDPHSYACRDCGAYWHFWTPQQRSCDTCRTDLST